MPDKIAFAWRSKNALAFASVARVTANALFRLVKVVAGPWSISLVTTPSTDSSVGVHDRSRGAPATEGVGEAVPTRGVLTALIFVRTGSPEDHGQEN